MKSYLPLLFVFLLVTASCTDLDTIKEMEMEDTMEPTEKAITPPNSCEYAIDTDTAIIWFQDDTTVYSNFAGAYIPSEIICDNEGTLNQLCFVFDYVTDGEEQYYMLHLLNVDEQADGYVYICSPVYSRDMRGSTWTKQTLPCSATESLISEANQNWSAHVPGGIKSFIVPADDISCVMTHLGNDCDVRGAWKDLYIQMGFDGEDVRLLITDVKDMNNVGPMPVFADMCLPCPDICGRFD